MSRAYKNFKYNKATKKKYSYTPEYISYRHARGGSIKTAFCDHNFVGQVESTFSLKRSPAVYKGASCEFVYNPPPEAGPAGLALEIAKPETGPVGINLENIKPEAGPTGIDLEHMAPVAGPVGVSVDSLNPSAGPTDLALEHLKPQAGPIDINVEVATQSTGITEPPNAVYGGWNSRTITFDAIPNASSITMELNRLSNHASSGLMWREVLPGDATSYTPTIPRFNDGCSGRDHLFLRGIVEYDDGSTDELYPDPFMFIIQPKLITELRCGDMEFLRINDKLLNTLEVQVNKIPQGYSMFKLGGEWIIERVVVSFYRSNNTFLNEFVYDVNGKRGYYGPLAAKYTFRVEFNANEYYSETNPDLLAIKQSTTSPTTYATPESNFFSLDTNDQSGPIDSGYVIHSQDELHELCGI